MNLLRSKCCDDCPENSPCEPCEEIIRCPVNTGKCCEEEPEELSLSVTIHSMSFYYRFLQGHAQAVSGSLLNEGSTATLYYEKHSEYSFSGFERFGTAYPVCCKSNGEILYEDGFRTCPNKPYWHYKNITVTSYNRETGASSTQTAQSGSIKFMGFYGNACTCETMINCSPMANGDFPIGILDGMDASPFGGQTFYANRYEWISFTKL